VFILVRGTTCTEIIQMARDVGAKKIYFASAAPPVRYPNLYGIDIPSRHELIAHERTEEEIAGQVHLHSSFLPSSLSLSPSVS
jgi:amidophosphoribosyltransferase